MHFHIITLFPKAFDSYLSESILKRAIENKKIAAAYHCQDLKCEDSLKNKINGIKAICIPLNKAKKNDKCILCNKTQSMIVYFAKSY